MGKTALFEANMHYTEYQAMERFGLTEMDYNLLPREERARKIAITLIDSFVSVHRMWESRPKGK